jgi:hypothetical protein
MSLSSESEEENYVNSSNYLVIFTLDLGKNFKKKIFCK